MLTTTLPQLACPKRKPARARGGPCGGELTLEARAGATRELGPGATDVLAGELKCRRCGGRFPILGGVAVLVDDVREYLLMHAKGVAQAVPLDEIPAPYRAEFREALDELRTEHIEEDLEAERVVSLYLMNHYLRVGRAERLWWQPDHGVASPVIDALVREHWDHGPFAQIARWVAARGPVESVVEPGCGVGGLYSELRAHVGRYLGIDSSFASIALARHVALGAPYPVRPRIPRDLLDGPVSADPELPPAPTADGRADYVVGDLDALPAARGRWAMSIVLNAIDMMDEPAALPRLQHELLAPGGIAIQSCPYIWHAAVAAELRKILPREIRDSARAVEWLYERAGLPTKERVDHLPWLFYKHARQLEIYSVHLMLTEKARGGSG